MLSRMQTPSVLVLSGLVLLLGCGSPGVGVEEPAPHPQPGTISTVDRGRETGSDPAQIAADEAELIRLEQAYARALIGKDRDFLMRFYAPDWRGGNWLGFWTKATMLKSVLNARYVVKSMELRDLKVRVMGDVAVVQGLDEEVTSMDGRDTSGRWTFTDIFARRGGRWVAIASHTSEVKPTPPS